MRTLISLVIAAVIATVAACSSHDEPPPPPKKEKEGRAETQSIRNTEAVGYSGKAIANKVDSALKTNDEQVKKAQQQSEEPPSQ